MTDPGQVLHQMQTAPPLVHKITNFVAMNLMANVLLAVGASPAMVHAREEVGDFARLAQVLTVNIGTADPRWGEAMADAADVMNVLGRPWVFDPVGVTATPFRQALSRRLIALRPTVIRGNASEILALAGLSSSGCGVDGGDSVEDAIDAARDLARQTGGVVAASGAVDYVTDGTDGYQVANGHPLMARVTAMGFALNGVIAAFCVGQPALGATAAALASYGLAGEEAAATASGPGSFQPVFLDALYSQTATKPDHAAPIGFDGLARIAARSHLPAVAIGGLDAGDAPALRRAGAACMAVVSAVSRAPDPEAATRSLVGEWRNA